MLLSRYVEKCRLAFREVKKAKSGGEEPGKGYTYDSSMEEGTLDSRHSIFLKSNAIRQRLGFNLHLSLR
jgi:hypothetical protein